VHPQAPGLHPAFLNFIEEGRIFISDSMVPLQRLGVIQPTLGWLGMDAGFQHLLPVHPANLPPTTQGDSLGGMHTAPDDVH
jgi:hypothetical protein